MNRLRVLDEAQMDRLHETTVEILENTGVILESDRALDIFRENGANIEGNRVFIPRKMLEAAIESAPSSFKLHGRNEEQSIIVGMDQNPAPY